MNMKAKAGAARAMDRIETLASFSALENGVLRAFLTPEHKAAHAQLGQWMEQAGLSTWQDAVGNQWGRKVSTDPKYPTLIIGSHSDTVVDAGKYDGTLGVIMGIEALELLGDVELPFHVDVVAFADEEGTRFNTTLLGSSAVAGKWQSSWLDIQDSEGTSMAQAFHDFGLNPELINSATRTTEEVLAYLEVHIEQGPLLESEDLAVGAVSAIAGAKRFLFQVDGVAGHAGTVPIHLRQDAFCAVAEMTLMIESYAKDKGIVATVGRCDIPNSAVNVIPGAVEFSLDIRSHDQALLEQCCSELLEEVTTIANKRQVKSRYERIYQAEAVPCDPSIKAGWVNAVEKVTRKPAMILASGAGHDAMVMASIAPMGMLFLRCERGISHNPLENVNTSDVAVALDCLVEMIKTTTDYVQ